MSTQHPDNVQSPPFASSHVINGEEEVIEAYYAFDTLGCDEQLWDSEGKEVDNFVVKKLFTKYPDYFQKHVLGKDVFLTLRVPNPEIERDEGKILLETLHSIPRNFDIAKRFYSKGFDGKGIAPIFEVFLPMCSSEKSIIRVHEYYKTFIIKSQDKPIYNRDISIAKWLGELNPKDIRVTPLFETKEALLGVDKFVEKYIRFEKIKELQRVWLARSDPALNYGSVAAVLLNKIALSKLHQLEQKTSVEIFPIFGCGSAPFRGNLKPTNVEKILAGYPSVQTFTVQSAFKYDFPEEQVKEGIEAIKSRRRKSPLFVDAKEAAAIVDKIEKDYQACINLLVPMINRISPLVPQRRRRKLHIGLFGYSRETSKVKLPRAIPFCASLYSLGLPPEFLGLASLKESDLDKIRQWYKNIDQDLADSMQYFNKETLSYFPGEIQKKVQSVLNLFSLDNAGDKGGNVKAGKDNIKVSNIDEGHAAITSGIVHELKHQNTAKIGEMIAEAGRIRQFLG